jgi:phosphocarrier protein HPr
LETGFREIRCANKKIERNSDFVGTVGCSKEDEMSVKAQAQVTITHEVGLHARPSVKFTKLAKSFAAQVEMALLPEGPWFDAKSIVKVMAAKAPKGTTMHLRAEGDDADEAVDALVGLVERDFDEGGAHARTA